MIERIAGRPCRETAFARTAKLIGMTHAMIVFILTAVVTGLITRAIWGADLFGGEIDLEDEIMFAWIGACAGVVAEVVLFPVMWVNTVRLQRNEARSEVERMRTMHAGIISAIHAANDYRIGGIQIKLIDVIRRAAPSILSGKLISPELLGATYRKEIKEHAPEPAWMHVDRFSRWALGSLVAVGFADELPGGGSRLSKGGRAALVDIVGSTSPSDS